MATQVQIRRGTTAQHSTFTGAAGEITIDTDKKTVVIHDGSTAGGTPLAKEVSLVAVYDQANAAYARANSSNDVLYIASSYNTANAAYDFANGVATNTTAAFAAANGVATNTTAAFGFANGVSTNTTAAFTVANAAYNTANGVATNTTAAFAAANTKLSNGSIMINGTVRPLALNETQVAPTISGGTLTIDCSIGNVFKVNLNSNITTLTFSNVPASNSAYVLLLSLIADGTARTVTWGSSVKWPGGTAPTLTSTNAKIDTFVLTTWDNGTNWYAFTAGQNA